MFTKYDFNPEKVADFQKKIKEIRDKLRNLIKVEDLKKDLNFSIIENITNPNEEDQFYREIIEKAYCYNFHKYFINNYIHDLIKLKMDGVNIYSKNGMTVAILCVVIIVPILAVAAIIIVFFLLRRRARAGKNDSVNAELTNELNTI